MMGRLLKFCLSFGLFLLGSFGSLAQKQKVILDCDLGDDIDDAYAMALVLSNTDQFELLGVTTCYGRTQDRAQLACKLLYETGMEKIPVAVGRNTSAQNERANWYADQFYYARGFSTVTPIQQDAADFIISQLKKYPNEVILFSVGPTTNMGDVIKKDPGALRLAKSLVAMFGSFYIGYNGSPTVNAEWNVRADVESAQHLVNCGAKLIYAGLDVTTFVKLDKVNREKLLYRQSPLTNALCGLTSLWGHERIPTLFDAVAIGYALYPELFKSQPAHISVDKDGYTRITDSLPSNCSILTYINSEEFINRIMKSYLHQNLGREGR